MAIHKIKNEETITDQPPSLHGRAIDNLEFIRDAMQRSTEFTAVPGYGGVLMGATAVGAGIIAGMQQNYRGWLITWLVEAILAFSIGLLMMWQKSKLAETSLTSVPARKFALGFTPPLIAGVILTALLYFNGLFRFLPTVWLTLYGTAVVSGGAYSVRAVPILGWIFIVLGAVSVFIPAAYGNWLMGIGFGGLHIIFGFVIARKYGG
ncbi:MAG: hypothetical protein R2681_14940 [Pyrinomonadaceae bacterium]